jgi:hypothetical protein
MNEVQPSSSQVEDEGEEQPPKASSSSLEMMDFPMDDSTPVTQQHHHHSSSISGGLFFADATLDLDEAHDIAETPEPMKLVMNTSKVQSSSIPMELPILASNTETPALNKESIPGKLGPNTANLMNRIDGGARGSAPSNHQSTYRPRPPRRPRDIPWLVAFFVFVPLSLLIASCLSEDPDEASQVAMSRASRRSSFFGLLLAFGASLGFARLLYKSMGGGEGEDARHIAWQVIMAFAPISLGVHTLLVLCIYLKTRNALGWSIIPLWFLARDLFAMRQWRTTASTAGGRQAFFQALCNMALDILSRSLRRSSFYRAVVGLVTIQLLVVFWWRAALLGALRHGSTFWFFVALIAGKWATGLVARMLGLVASGGVTTWFVQQSVVMEEIEQRKAEGQKGQEDIDYSANNNNSSTVPDEYGSADASAYQPVLDMDNGIDDDFDEQESGGQGSGGIWSDSANSTVLSFLAVGVRVSLGSVAQCGLLGGLAQFVWSILRNVDVAVTTVSQRFPTGSRSGFRGMQVGQQDGIGIVYKVLGRINILARSFVRSHTDLAMCQVAAYYKSYQRAAQDVSILVDGSGKYLNVLVWYR